MNGSHARCRVCGCTNTNCTLCVARTREACHWVESDLCSACAVSPKLPVMRMLQVNECGVKPDWDMMLSGSLPVVVKECEEHDALLRDVEGADARRRYLIKATPSALVWKVWVETCEDTGHATALKRCMSERKEFERMLSSSGLLWLLRIAAKQTGRMKRHDLTHGGDSSRMKGEDLAWLLQAGHLQESGLWVEVTDQGNALVRDVLVFAQKWEGGKEP